MQHYSGAACRPCALLRRPNIKWLIKINHLATDDPLLLVGFATRILSLHQRRVMPRVGCLLLITYYLLLYMESQSCLSLSLPWRWARGSSQNRADLARGRLYLGLNRHRKHRRKSPAIGTHKNRWQQKTESRLCQVYSLKSKFCVQYSTSRKISVFGCLSRREQGNVRAYESGTQGTKLSQPTA